MSLIGSDNSAYSRVQVAMTLAEIAYEPEASIDVYLERGKLATGGRWKRVWFANNDANQVYIAKNEDTGQFAVCIRGTVTKILTTAFWEDLRQDLDILSVKDWPFGGAPEGAKIADGTLLDLHSLLSLTDDGLGVVGFLDNALQGVDHPVLVVGHSLGGALASVFAPCLHAKVSVGNEAHDFHSISFAAPTAGNTVLADYIESGAYGGSERYFNDLDIVPHAWAALDWIADSFPGGPTLPTSLSAALEVVALALDVGDYDYTQPGAGSPLKGSLCDEDDWFGEAAHQHAGTTYLCLLDAPWPC